jgi:predicted RNA binding protein YcfA (HicA-like mRNA interferase family)
MKYRDVLRLLAKDGWKLARETGRTANFSIPRSRVPLPSRRTP